MMNYMLQESSDSSNSGSDGEDEIRNRSEDDESSTDGEDVTARDVADEAHPNESDGDSSANEKMDVVDDESGHRTKRRISDTDP